MVDKEHVDGGGGEDGELCCEITGLSSTEANNSLSKAYSTVFSRLKYLKIGLIISLLLNVIFMGLFAVVFVKLNDFNTRQSYYDDTLNEFRSNMYAITQPNIGRTKGENNDKVLMDKKNLNVVKSSSRPSVDSMSSTPTQVPKRVKLFSTPMSTMDSCKCRGPPGQRGPQGERGPMGDQGHRGKKGNKGKDGTKGDNGDIGRTGPIGKHGPTGLQGLLGPRGASGAKGEPGTSCKACNASLSQQVMKERPIVHLTGSSPTHSGKIEYEPLNIWTTSNVLGHSTYGMFSPASTSQITITESGQYFIYSQLYFQINFKDTGSNLDDNLKTYMVHFVFRKSGLSETLLMRAVTSNGLVNNRSGFYTSFTCGVHPLKKGDTLFVGVQKKQSVIVNSGDTSSFFGTFKV